MTNQTADDNKPSEYPLAELGITRIDLKKVPRSLSAILDEIAPQGEKVKVADIAGSEITVHSVRPFRGAYGPAAFVIFTDENGVLFNTIIGQKIVLAKLLAAIPYLPVTMVIEKKEGGAFGEYYDAQ